MVIRSLYILDDILLLFGVLRRAKEKVKVTEK